jgi:hypothetical protein
LYFLYYYNGKLKTDKRNITFLKRKTNEENITFCAVTARKAISSIVSFDNEVQKYIDYRPVHSGRKKMPQNQ